MKRFFCVVFLTVFLFTSCTVTYESNTYFALDTFISTNLPSGTAVDIEGYIRSLEALISKTDKNSEISRINENVRCTVSHDVASLLSFALEISEKTNGAFDVTCGAVSSLWDFRSDTPRPPSHEDIKKNLQNVGYYGIITDGDTSVEKASNDVKIDLGGIGKGYIAEKCVDRLHENGVDSGFISLGGNIAVVGKKENGDGWNVALRDPFRQNETVGNIVMESGYLSVSGDYERYFEYEGEKYHHIIDPKTGYPAVNELASVAVLCDNGALADALSTALFVMGLDGAMQFYKDGIYTFEAVCITKNGDVYTTDGINEKFKLTSENFIMK